MSLSKRTLNTLIAGAFAVSLAGAAGSSFADSSNPAQEKCYGIAKAGQNDCGTKGDSHACAGSATLDGDGSEFVVVPKGLCERLVGGMLEPSDKKGTEPVDGKKG